MKPSSLTLTAIVTPNIAFAAWMANTRVIVAGIAATGIACGVGSSMPSCAIVAVVALFSTIFSAIFNGGDTGGIVSNPGDTGGIVSNPGDLEDGTARAGTKRHSYTVAHHHPNGTVYNGLKTKALEVGVWHTVQTGEHTLRTTKHADGFNIVQIDLEASGVVERQVDENAINTVSAQFGDENLPMKDTWSDDDLNNLANKILQGEGPLTAESLCSTISTDTDADTFDVS